ncbi:MAG: hypothetical protein H6581_19990 [Bacteroidia bacterium]|nr:hypothetical protein [Bacteroidia bacterium]
MSQKAQHKDSSQATSSQTSQSNLVSIKMLYPRNEAAAFYIQSSGHDAGRPSLNPIFECWAVYSRVPHLFEIAQAIHISGFLRALLDSSPIPAMQLEDYHAVLESAARVASRIDPCRLRSLAKTEKQIRKWREQEDRLVAFQEVVAMDIMESLNLRLPGCNIH